MRIRPLAVLVSCVLVTTFASAQPRKKIRDELPENARPAWDAGIQAMQESPPEWARASAKLQEAYDLSHNPRVLFNVGVAERNLEHYSRALAKFKQELAEGTKLTAQDKAEIQQTISALEKLVSTVDLTVNEPDAAVFLDDFKVGVTPTPPIPADVKSTPHVLRIEKDGFEPFEKRDLIVGSSAPVKLSVELEPKNKKSMVEIAVVGAPGASVFVDGIDRGAAPFKGLVDVGAHTFEARQPGYETTSQRQEVVYKTPLRVQLALERERDGFVHLETIEGATIEVNGKAVGTTVWEGSVKPGTITVNTRKPGYNPGQAEFVVHKGETVNRSVPMTSEQKNEWVFWTVGTLVVVAGAATAAGFVFAPSSQKPVIGTFDPGLVKTSHGIRF